MTMPRIRLLVTDLDNTLYDWLGFFVPSFYAMIRTAAPIIGLTDDEIIAEFKEVNTANDNTEKPFALLELPSVRRQFGSLTLTEQKRMFDGAFHEFNRVRKQTLLLYEGVSETLAAIRGAGTIIVAHTDAHIHNALFRMRSLGLMTTISRLYAPVTTVSAEDKDLLGNEYVSVLPASDRKPNPRVLLDICEQHRVEPVHTLYVGDSLVRDIAMAREAGTHSAYAEYGSRSSPELWKQLVRVTHWSAEAAQKEKASDRPVAAPDVVLLSFSDLMKHFTFERSTPVPMRGEEGGGRN
jgi:phosphoglycolate phosphatase-like HAD superfamily hydrolase